MLTAFLGYVFVVVVLLFDLGQPHRIWHALIMWNPRSVMFEVVWCVMRYTTVLALEFAPVFCERLNPAGPQRILRRIVAPLVNVGVLLSTLHQSSLGTLYLIVPDKLHPLWYSPFLPIFFFISALAAGLGMLLHPEYEGAMFLLEFGLGVLLLVAMLAFPRIRNHEGGWCSAPI